MVTYRNEKQTYTKKKKKQHTNNPKDYDPRQDTISYNLLLFCLKSNILKPCDFQGCVLRYFSKFHQNKNSASPSKNAYEGILYVAREKTSPKAQHKKAFEGDTYNSPRKEKQLLRRNV